MREVIDRFTYKRIKGYNREQLNEWLTRFGTEMLALRDEFGFGTQRIGRFMEKRDNTIDCINRRLISVPEIIDGLRGEGLKIKTDFEPEVPEAPKK